MINFNRNKSGLLKFVMVAQAQAACEVNEKP